MIIQKWNQGSTDGSVLEKSKTSRKYDNQLDVDEMHTQFYSVFIQTSSGDFDIFRATAMDMLRIVYRVPTTTDSYICQSDNPTNDLNDPLY